jgi:[ribosomal protein S5]-alanine N-acetyltransferase
MFELERLRADHSASVLAFELENRAYFASFISDRGDEYFSSFADDYSARMSEQDAGTCIFHVLVGDDGAVQGRFNLFDLNAGTAELGYRVAQQVAGRGVATATVESLCQLAANQYGVRHLRAATSFENVASRRVLEKAGFTTAGPALPGGRPGIWYERDLIPDAC